MSKGSLSYDPHCTVCIRAISCLLNSQFCRQNRINTVRICKDQKLRGKENFIFKSKQLVFVIFEK